LARTLFNLGLSQSEFELFGIVLSFRALHPVYRLQETKERKKEFVN